MATVNKDFKIKSGLVVEGTTGTINGLDILTKKQADQDYIVGLIGGTATSENTPNTVVKRDANGDFAADNITVNVVTITGAGSISEDGELLIAAVEGEDIKLTADDIRLESVDDIRMTATGDILLDASEPGMGVYVGSIGTGNTVVTEAIMDTHIGDGTVDGTAGNTVTDRISTALSSATQAVTDHNALTTGVHGVTGDVVGTTNEQTLTNKTISYTDNTLTVQVANVSDLTATASELNVLDGITATTTELNYVDGVTSGIQGQLDDKAPLASPSLTGTPLAPTATPGTNNTQIATTAYADAAVAALVDAAPGMLDTLNELAAALGDDEDFIGTVNAAIGEKVAKAGDTMTGALTLSGAPTSANHAATKDYVDQAEADAISTAEAYVVTREEAITTAYEAYADTAEQDAKDYADDLINDASNLSTEVWSAYKTATEIGIAQQAATDVANSLTTDDVAEGTNKYFTDALAKTSAGDLLAGATTDNVDITYINGVLSISAENGVADSTTDDLAEGATNKYFSDSLALSAINDANIQPESIDITWVRREEATWTDVPTASKATCHSAGTNEGSMKYLVRVTASVGGTRHSHVTEVLATVDGSNGVAVVEYGTIYTSTEPLATVTVEWNASTSKYDLNVTTANNSSEVMVAATLMATLD
jgi:hypothetical protein